MANILGNVFKGKDGISGGMAPQGAGSSPATPGIRPANGNFVNMQTSGRPGGQTTTHSSSANSSAAQLARERAEAAKAQIEMRKAAEAARKDEKGSFSRHFFPLLYAFSPLLA